MNVLFFLEKNKIHLWCTGRSLPIIFEKFCFLKKLILIILFISTAINSIHASDDNDSRVWIDFIEEDKVAFIKGLFVNLSDEANSFDWEMKLEKSSVDGIKKESFNGSFIANPLDPIMVSELEIDLTKKEYFVIIFNVFNKSKNLIGTDTLNCQKLDPTLKPPSYPKPIVKNNLPKPGMNSDAIEIDGLILDETRTKIGRDFYELFYSKWTPPLKAKDFLITIKELPSRGIGGTRVSIEVNNNVILNRFLQPRHDIVEEQANISISAVRRYLEQNEDLKQSIDSEDAVGSGIF